MARKSKNTEAPVFDAAAIASTAAPAQLPDRSRVVESHKWDDNPFLEPVQESQDTGEGRQVSVPAYHVREVVAGLRDAARKVGCGLRVVLVRPDGTTTSKVADIVPDDQPIAVQYLAKMPRASLDVDQTEEARREGFVNPETNRVQVRPYLDWVNAGRPREDAGE